MPPSTIIHYKSAFEIESESADIANEIKRIIRKWIQKRRDVGEIGKDAVAQSWFYTGNQDQTKCGSCIRTAANIGKYDSFNPEHWVLELIHGDNKYPQRLWSVNIGITRIDIKKLGFRV